VKLLKELGRTNLMLCACFASDGSMVWSNKLYNKYFKNASGSHFKNMVIDDDIEKVIKICALCRRKPGTLYTLQVRAMATGHVWSLFSFEIHYSSEGVFGVVGVRILEHVRLGVNGDSEALQKLKETMREIAYIQSHELRPPVARILGLTDLLSSSSDIDDIKLFTNLVSSNAKELDQKIKEITDKTSEDYTDEE
jgi:light-regulated signal transduction histidine kinase (bacteriophytochrome)